MAGAVFDKKTLIAREEVRRILEKLEKHLDSETLIKTPVSDLLVSVAFLRAKETDEGRKEREETRDILIELGKVFGPGSIDVLKEMTVLVLMLSFGAKIPQFPSPF